MIKLAPQKQTYPRWVGVLLGLLLPAHFLSGSRSEGTKWLLALLLLSIVVRGVVAIPLAGAVGIGILLAFLLFPLLSIAMLCKSYRPVPRLRPGGWLAFTLALVFVHIIPAWLSDGIAVPYKIPTGAMQPTLRGITTDGSKEETSWVDGVVAGKKHTVSQALEAGRLGDVQRVPEGIVCTIGSTEYCLPGYVLPSFRRKPFYNKGDVLWKGTVLAGDRIMVEKTTYWFRPPRKGDIVVFSTENIEYPQVRNDTFYTKRIVATPGDTIRIQPPHILIENKPLAEPAVFTQLAFRNAGEMASPTNSVTLGEDQYFVLGDNSAMSLDSRYFGPIKRDAIVGRVSTIYWPFTRMGAVR